MKSAEEYERSGVMMDWTKQTEEMIKTWSDAQQKMWESWRGAMQGSESSRVTEGWEQAIAAWRTSVERALQAQVEWTQRWADTIASGANTPKEVADWSRQVLDVTQRWTEAQKSLWARYFETMERASPSAMSTTLSDEAQKVSQAWQEAIQKSVEAQQEWLRLSTAGQIGQKNQ